MSSISNTISLEQGRKAVVVSECYYYSRLTRMICQGPNEQLASYPLWSATSVSGSRGPDPTTHSRGSS